MWAAIWRRVKRSCLDYSQEMGQAIDEGDIRRIILKLLRGLLFVIGVLGGIDILIYVITLYANELFVLVGLPVLLICVLIYWIHTKPVNTTDDLPDMVEEELTRQRAREQYDDLLALMFNAIQGVANITPLVRPHDLYDIQTGAPAGDHFYLKGCIPIYQFECDVESEVDRNTEDIIQRELQRHVIKQSPRYPLLASSEAQGRAPIEVLDTKNLGGRVLVECCLTSSASIPMIEARRRVRIERQQRSADIYDRDF